jgi:hypothetical protein
VLKKPVRDDYDTWFEGGSNEKDASTFDLTFRPLSGAVNTGLLLNSDGGARVKTSRNLEKKHSF